MKVSKEKERKLVGQKAVIWRLLRTGKKINQTQTQAMGLGWKLASRLGEISQELGIEIKRGWITTGGGARIREYWL